MWNWFTALTTVRSPNEDVQRRGRSLIILSLGMALLALAFIPVAVATNAGPGALVTTSVATVIFLGAALLGRAGQVELGAYLLLGFTLFAIVASIPNEGSTPNTPFYLVLVILLGSALLPPMQIWAIFVASVLGVALGIGLLPAEIQASPMWRQAATGVPLLLTVIALISFISARTTTTAIAAAQQARLETERANTSLAASNSALETRVEERTAALRLIADEQRALAAELKDSLAAQQELNRVIAELAVPILPISSGSLVVPLIGSIDSGRAKQLLSTILERVEATGARILLLDVTGVALIDTQVAAALLQIAEAARLMGAKTMLVGIRPEVAQTLVQLGVDLRALNTAASLQDGVAALVRGIK